MNTHPQIAIIGAGAAGCFAAVEVKRRCPAAVVTIYESGRRPLSKVAITGGGRCNITNTFVGVRSMADVYPRGERLMKRLLREFDSVATLQWFEREGIRFVTQADECVFPASQDAMEVVRTLTRAMERCGVKLCCNRRIVRAELTEGGRFRITLAHTDSVVTAGSKPSRSEVEADYVLVASGGAPKASGLDWLSPLGVERVNPVPSLFSFCVSDESLQSLTGTVVEEAVVSLPSTKFRAAGALLITHRGVSGPAALKLSSYAARWLAEQGYRSRLAIGWLSSADEARQFVQDAISQHGRKQVSSFYPRALNARLWEHLLRRCGILTEKRWSELGRKETNKLVETLTNDLYPMEGRNPSKEEFVTCGGVALNGVDARTLESKVCPRLYFAGEVLNVDAITGGFNLQAAWTMGMMAARGMAQAAQREEDK